MLAVVLPAKNEAARIQTVLRYVLRLPVGLVVPVVNGSDDMTTEILRRQTDTRIRPLLYGPALGYDVPRIAGAKSALEQGALAVLFVDADLVGKLETPLLRMVDRMRTAIIDLALSDCYAGKTPVPYRDSTASRVYGARVKLNRTLGRPDLGAAIPSHGPVGLSRDLLTAVPPSFIGVPPLMQAWAIKAGRTVEVATSIPHRELGSAPREPQHRQRIAETIIGDCHMGMAYVEDRPLNRDGHDGYHSQRRFDLLGLTAPEGEWAPALEIGEE